MTKETDRPGRIQFAEEEVHGARIKVVGVGGGGGNAIHESRRPVIGSCGGSRR